VFAFLMKRNNALACVFQIPNVCNVNEKALMQSFHESSEDRDSEHSASTRSTGPRKRNASPEHRRQRKQPPVEDDNEYVFAFLMKRKMPCHVLYKFNAYFMRFSQLYAHTRSVQYKLLYIFIFSDELHEKLPKGYRIIYIQSIYL
jgi:hypothetical protein